MNPRFKDFMRRANRDHGIVGTIVASGIFGLLGAIGFAAGPVVGACTSLGFFAAMFSLITFGTNRAIEKNIRAELFQPEGSPYTTIFGPGKNIATIRNVQTKIHRLTENFKHSAQLPKKVEDKLAPHISDAQEAARHVRAGHNNAQNIAVPLDEIHLTRVVFSPAGMPQNISYAVLPVSPQGNAVTATPAAPAAAPAIVPPGTAISGKLTLKNKQPASKAQNTP